MLTKWFYLMLKVLNLMTPRGFIVNVDIKDTCNLERRDHYTWIGKHKVYNTYGHGEIF